MYRNTSGISLVELLVVTALIGILASVVGPQLLSFAVQGYNANASADLRNAAAAEKAFFADWGVYASSSWGGIAGSGNVFNSFMNSTGSIPMNSISMTAPRGPISDPGFAITVSQNVGLVINTSAGGGSYVMAAKNMSGDRCFGRDSDIKEVYWVNGSPGATLFSGAAPAATAGWNDYSGIYGMFPCNGLQGGAGQLSWTAL